MAKRPRKISLNMTGDYVMNGDKRDSTMTYAKYNAGQKRYYLTPKLYSESSFAVETFTMKSGPFENCHVLILNPSPPPTKQVRFMNFPPEIRNMIYRYALGDYTVDCCRSRYHSLRPYIFRDRIQRPILSLLFVSKQVHAEAASIFYGCNRFFFRDMTVANLLLSQINRQNRTYLTDISIQENVKRASKAVGRLLADAANIRRLQLGLFSSSFRRHVPAMKEFVNQFREVLGKICRGRTQTEVFTVVKIGIVPVRSQHNDISSFGRKMVHKGPWDNKEDSCDHQECKTYRAHLQQFKTELFNNRMISD